MTITRRIIARSPGFPSSILRFGVFVPTIIVGAQSLDHYKLLRHHSELEHAPYNPHTINAQYAAAVAVRLASSYALLSLLETQSSPNLYRAFSVFYGASYHSYRRFTCHRVQSSRSVALTLGSRLFLSSPAFFRGLTCRTRKRPAGRQSLGRFLPGPRVSFKRSPIFLVVRTRQR